jgi:disulfide bond formation protein DsbB
MFNNIKKLIPSKLKIGKFKRRIVRFGLWFAGLGISIYHVVHAVHIALQTKVTTGELSVVKKLKICVTNATTDVATILSDAGFTGTIAINAFLRYFWENPVIAFILIVTVYEAIKNLNKATRYIKLNFLKVRK